ncbi:amidohydrolase family protein [Rubrobacter marinus]|uniref:amidohydrolase family protein n=1 Tax=Rubrobacter marinus TaxID=2653852 RepID=UPI00140D2722|nr:amidohydrolase family protein [Rubrobacter marinus]
MSTKPLSSGDLGALTNGAMAEVWGWVRAKLPAGIEVFDAHAHIGTDVDSRVVTAEDMKERMDAAGVARAIVFPLNDPNARDDFSGPNDVLWNAYEKFPDAFVPFFRLNPHKDYEAEFARCVDRGFLGLKLHPVSQEFELDDERVVRLFEMAAEADIPVLVHAGFAMQRIVEPLMPTIERLPGLRLILGHSAMVEVLAATRAFADHPNILFETSVVKAKDLYVLFNSMDPSRVCFGSDIPYGDLPSTMHAALLAADAAGLSEDELSGVFSRNIRRWFP